MIIDMIFALRCFVLDSGCQYLNNRWNYDKEMIPIIPTVKF